MKAFPELTAALREMLDRMDVSLRAGGYEGPPVIMYLAGRVAHGIHGIHGKADGRRAEKENDYENEERSRAEEWPTEYTERGTGGGRRKRTITRTRNDRGRRSGPRNTRMTRNGGGGELF